VASALATTGAERQEFRLSVRRFFADRSPESEVRRLGDDPLGYDPVVWKQLGAELGLLGLLVPEQAGGQGLTVVEVVVALEEAGRALLCAPLLSSAVLAPLALEATSTPLLGRLADGSSIAAVALDADIAVSADGTLSGRATGVLDAHVADALLLVVDGDLFQVGAGEVRLTTHQTIDLATRLSTVDIDGVRAERLGPVDVERLRSLAAVASAAHLVGVGAAALELAVGYALTREQFGKPIGSYQGIKHLVADMHARLESSRAAVAVAAEVAVTRPAELAEHAAIAKAWCSTAMVRNAEDCIQVLGGIGFTWEHPAHLLLRRAKLHEMLFGDARVQRQRLARLLGLV
jgi:alkylation response protein AidB-like acyl-CoA dehydrogenase